MNFNQALNQHFKGRGYKSYIGKKYKLVNNIVEITGVADNDFIFSDHRARSISAFLDDVKRGVVEEVKEN